ncbi:hypothetical protein EJ05DRAFT_472981 [Pseudovirgaria hyperparasitica]|uniref:VPS9 domain-containing protein n=1 Tax=Pseudovirgaria hyperparasitica TaxID=470096 RepID=A0A6A6WK10_9PEZI|nr:uncharacterized protein EJ05DRAFT_472981 [Pseudovirgaria hyperparasitica]KAF2762051.1 hypothetical protein EJ05DRAFT_472981 [Pseudovirgaria hyperparasitica]
MHPLNPFLRAFFRSTLPAQCSPVQHHVLLVPTTEVLSNARDHDTNALYTDLASSEDFLASHVIRVPGGGFIPPNNSKDVNNFRESRGKAKQYSTCNGRTVIIKDSFVYSNKGFKTLNQAQLLQDVIYYPDTTEAPAWVIYYISKPLVGTYEKTPILPAIYPIEEAKGNTLSPAEARSPKDTNVVSATPKKKDVKSFNDLLNNFPMIARQMQSGLERLFKEFGKEFDKPLPAIPAEDSTRKRHRRSSSVSSSNSVPISIHSTVSTRFSGVARQIEISDEEDIMRTALETAVTAAIDLFQMVDKAQLSLLGASTDLTGPMVERMIERYVTEQVHGSVLFPRVCQIRKLDDVELEKRIRQMTDVDISQVGVPIEGGREGRRELTIRLTKAVAEFKKMGVAESPQEMMDVLLSTQKALTTEAPETLASNTVAAQGGGGQVEKPSVTLTVNADTLVSLLLIVVIRSSIRHLHARLSYMRHFIFIDDVESGEIGYALSTFEAVVSYLASDAASLRKSSRRNRKLWEATKAGNISVMREVLEQGNVNGDGHTNEMYTNRLRRPNSHDTTDNLSIGGTTLAPTMSQLSSQRSSIADVPGEAGLAHVFPFARAHAPSPPLSEMGLKRKKRVTLDTRSMSSSSLYSYRSRSDTVDSRASGYSGVEGDTGIKTLCHTQGPDGDSVLMMAVVAKQAESLGYLLSLHDYFGLDEVLEDCNNEGTTLLSAAVQSGHEPTSEVLMDYILDLAPNEDVARTYIKQQDDRGRCAGHYMFNQPELISRIGHLIDWTLKDKNGQTPLFALCRCYDHDKYRWMVEQGLSAATSAQGDEQALHLDEHMDSKGNTLLHIANDAQVALRLLYHADSDVNASNERHFTPLMVASKYGRTELVRALFGDARVDVAAKDLRGLTAVELAKDDEVRNRIDDLILMSNDAGKDGRITTVVRSFFVEDGSIRLVLKSGAPNENSTITVTTCRRSLTDFENLSRWLATELPASWLPAIGQFPSPFLIPSKPSRAVLRDIQVQLDTFLKILLGHSTFSTHEMVWEFFLVPEMDPSLLAERSRRKAETRSERVREEYSPVRDVREVETFVQHALESVRSVHHSAKSVVRRSNKVRTAGTDLSEAAALSASALASLAFLPPTHVAAYERYTKAIGPSESEPMQGFYYSMVGISSTITAILAALGRPSSLIGSMGQSQKAIERHSLSIRRSDRWPLGLLDDTRSRIQRDAADKMDKSLGELESLGKELRYTQQTVAGELAAWQESHARTGREACRKLARRMVVQEKARLESMRRAIRGLGLGLGTGKRQRGTDADAGAAATMRMGEAVSSSEQNGSAGVGQGPELE